MPNTILITGSAGLVGSEASRYFAEKGYNIVGIDNNMRAQFFGKEASTDWVASKLKEEIINYHHKAIDIRNHQAIDILFNERQTDIVAIIHTAAQPSHDWAATNPTVDFEINANGTLNLLESFRKYSPSATFIFTSTNKVYGDRPNLLSFKEEETRYEVYDTNGNLYPGINESTPIDKCIHSIFGVSKLSADLLVQEYGRYFKLNTVCFRGGCLTGSRHSRTELHGFLSYLMRCTVTGKEYKIYGYNGKQVRDNIHSRDLIKAFHEFIKSPQPAKVYNIGGGRQSNCSIQEAIKACEARAGKKLATKYIHNQRKGDHQWYISDLSEFKKSYPQWKLNFTINDIYDNIYQDISCRLNS